VYDDDRVFLFTREQMMLQMMLQVMLVMHRDGERASLGVLKIGMITLSLTRSN